MSKHSKRQSAHLRFNRFSARIAPYGGRSPVIVYGAQADRSFPRQRVRVLFSPTYWSFVNDMFPESAASPTLVLLVRFDEADAFFAKLDALTVIVTTATQGEPRWTAKQSPTGRMRPYGPNLQSLSRSFAKVGAASKVIVDEMAGMNMIFGKHFVHLLIDDPHKSNDQVDAVALALGSKISKP